MKPSRSSDAQLLCTVKATLWMILTLSLVVTPVVGQRRAGAPRKPAAEPQAQLVVAFDTLLAADSYKIYGEVRGMGQLIRSEGVKDLLDPVLKLAAPPKEFKSLVKWLNTRADALTTSRLLFAAWPTRPKLPQTLVAIEFPSPEEAQKFEPQLKDFLPKLLPAPTPEGSPAANQTRGQASETKQNEKPGSPPYILKQVGSLVFITDSPFALKDLKPQGSKLLAEDQNFRLVHDRFSSESVFLYLDVAAINKEENERQQKSAEEQKRIEEEAAKQPKSDEAGIGSGEAEVPVIPTPEEPQPGTSPTAPVEAAGATSQTTQAAGGGGGGRQETTATTELVAQPSGEETKRSQPDPMDTALFAISNAFFGGRPKWPEAVGAALVFEGDSYVLRVMLVNAPDEKVISPIPFFPQFVSGPALVPEAPSILPADTELFVSASLDFPQIYEGMLTAANAQFEQMQRIKLQSVKNTEVPSPFAVYEKKLGIKFKDDLLPLLGNELALTVPMQVLGAGPSARQPSPGQQVEDDSRQKQTTPAGPSPIFAVAVKDRQAVRALLPRMIDSLGLKGASMLAQTEKRDDTELVSYANMFAYAFVGNFLVFSPDVKATRHVVDSYLNHETLSSSTHFRNYTRWQPRQVLGQAYVSPVLMESYNLFARESSQISDQFRDFLMLLSPLAQPVTYAISNEGLGPLHELHIPKNLVMLMVAGASSESNDPPVFRNESITRNAVRTIASAEATYQATEGAGRYGTLDELIKAGLISKEMVQNYGYKIELSVSNTRFEVTAVPIEYGKTGKLSFFLDDSSVLRAGDHGGGAATIADKPGD